MSRSPRIVGARLVPAVCAVLAAHLCQPMAARAEDAAATLANRLYFYSGMDVARDNAYGWAGAAWAPFAPMDREGLRLRAQGGLGQYRYRTDAVAGGWNTGTKTEGEMLAGWQFLRGPHALALYGGANVVDNRLQNPDPSNPDQGTQTGAKAVAEYYGRLRPDLIATAAAGFSTADRTATLRLTAAKVLESGWEIGAEAGALTDRLSSEMRAGGFVNLPLLGAMVRAAAGWRWSSDSDDGAYGTLSLYRPY
ncbi:cellulose biosynthesis protein BcsS [Ancylobacter lacus]|uniref:cellulose biosynthesis protein BcsS n=1 Tax=Ancylobacter lacus TaxID=2579970 RepID=UPI001FE432E3|nr:cellulose biosynthesis protein BcsS [Ancylobacter lacus]